MSRRENRTVITDAEASGAAVQSGDGPARAGRGGWLLAAAVLAGCVASWSLTLAAPGVELQLGALRPRQQELEAAAQEIARLGPEDSTVLVLSPDPEDAAFARY